jgi:hypothetical protein
LSESLPQIGIEALCDAHLKIVAINTLIAKLLYWTILEVLSRPAKILGLVNPRILQSSEKTTRNNKILPHTAKYNIQDTKITLKTNDKVIHKSQIEDSIRKNPD